MTVKGEKVDLPVPDQADDELYGVVASRRSATDSMMWQTPVLSLTAQAFLFTIVLGAGNSPFARILAGLLSVISSFASIQLMMKHRYMEIRDAKWLEGYERKHKSCVLHAKPANPPLPDHQFLRWLLSTTDSLCKKLMPFNDFLVGRSSYRVWVVALGVFWIAALGAVLIAFFCPRWFR